jgi:hypothetical protein
LAASASIKGREVGLVFRTSLTNILDDNQPWQAYTLAIEEVLVDAARIDANALLKKFIIVVSPSASSTESIDGVESWSTITVASGDIEYFVDAAAVTFGLVAVLYFHCRSAVDAVSGVGEDC